MTGFYDKLLLDRAIRQRTGRGARGAIQRGGPFSAGQRGSVPSNNRAGYGGFNTSVGGPGRGFQTGTVTTREEPARQQQSSMIGNPLDMYNIGKKGRAGFKDWYKGQQDPGGMFGSGGLFGPDPVQQGLMQGPSRGGTAGIFQLTPDKLGQTVGNGAAQGFAPGMGAGGTTPWTGGVNAISGAGAKAPNVINLTQQANMPPAAVQAMNQAAGFPQIAAPTVTGTQTATSAASNTAANVGAKGVDAGSKAGSNLLGKAGVGLGAGLSIYDMTQNGVNLSNALGLAGAGAMGMGMMAGTSGLALGMGAANFWNPLGWALMAGSIGSSFF